ncbi:GNAT family N-acetyltransferase [Bifidobacterium crudilactis]|jgi:ribosomal protein S18 acetylase RimI-like enzyme|uniref:GNAT family N-acetyltransferase n=1 Tax=Bifidobacterium crudilactis TaxID=327277 RepID=UPI00054F8669|nr:GNAT family N-acetyltransferase [Bifidobacterium crudilactis]MCI2148108.1 GNAT family N-acetyltransferase [Bifidobacterium crudilactis]MCI2157210.1 GNAT family N-acetyltransferase [Bifidobacterium crudilactis]
MDGITFTTCTAANLDELRSLCIDTFTDTFAKDNSPEDMNAYVERSFSPERLDSELSNPRSTFIMAYIDGIPAGYMKLNTGTAQTEVMNDDAMEIERLYILTRFKRHGLGTSLIRQAEETAMAQGASTIWLGVWEHNEPARSFYTSRGFVKTGQHVFMLGDDEQTDHIMCKRLQTV